MKDLKLTNYQVSVKGAYLVSDCGWWGWSLIKDEYRGTVKSKYRRVSFILLILYIYHWARVIVDVGLLKLS